MNNNPFALFTDRPGWEDASIDIAAVIKAQINLVKQNKIDATDGWKEIQAVLRKYEPWGANDSASREAASDAYWGN